MSQYGSDSDRPRGRRHRPDSDWSEYGAAPQSDREFPDLQPIRPRGAGERDARQPGGFGGGAVPGTFQGNGNVPGAPGTFDAFGGGQQAPQGLQEQGFQEQAPSQYGQYGQPEAPGQYGGAGGGEYGGAEYGGAPRSVGRHSAAQPVLGPQHGMAPQPEMGSQQGMGSQPGMAPQALPQDGPRHGRRAASDGWDDQDSDDPMAAFSARWNRRGQENPGDGGRRKRVYAGAAGLLVIIIAGAAYFMISGKGTGSDPNLGALVTTFLPGELKQVPDACTTVQAGTIAQAVPGPVKQSAPPMNSGQQSVCSWTSPKTAQDYRVLEVSINAYAPSTLASGDGSATFAAIDGYTTAQAAKQNPGKGQTPATIANISNLGSSAFSAVQQFQETGGTTTMATIEVRYHNALVQVVLNAVGGQVPGSTLVSQAQAIAQQVTSKVSAG